uniref:DNA damage-binding protein 1 n=1 Tax=Mesocestoides corti TaxID=53468 RepID=A0A5K3EIZ8_MESCO
NSEKTVLCVTRKAKKNPIFILKRLPTHGNLFCKHKKLQLGEVSCETPVYEHSDDAGLIDVIGFHVSSQNNVTHHHSEIILPITISRSSWMTRVEQRTSSVPIKHLKITLNDTMVVIGSTMIDGAKRDVYDVTKSPTYGGVYLGGSFVRSFSFVALEQGVVFYKRSPEFNSDFLQDNFELTTYNNGSSCKQCLHIIRVMIALVPVSKTVIFEDIVYLRPQTDVPINLKNPSVCLGICHLTLRPMFGQLLLDNVPFVKINFKQFSLKRISYRRLEWNTSNDEFVFESQQPPCSIIFRIVNSQLIRFKSIYVPFNNEFTFNERHLDISLLESSSRRLITGGYLRMTSTLKQALKFEFPQKTAIGTFFGPATTQCQKAMLCFFYKDLLEGNVKFINFPNVTVRAVSEFVNVYAPGLMAPQRIPLKMSIISTNYKGNNNILLSDFVDEGNLVKSQNGVTTHQPKLTIFANIKMGVAAFVGLVCFAVCIFVTAAYFLVRKWRNEQRFHTQSGFDHAVCTGRNSPKFHQRPLDQYNAHSSTSFLMVPMPASEAQSTFTSVTSGDENIPWDRKPMKEAEKVKSTTEPVTTVCFIGKDTGTCLGSRGSGPTSVCFVSSISMNPIPSLPAQAPCTCPTTHKS